MKTGIRSVVPSPLMIVLFITLVFGLGTAAISTPYFLLESDMEWEKARMEGKIQPMESSDWSDYMGQWNTFLVEGEPYPENTFIPPIPPNGELYVYGGGGGGGCPEDAGLVMVWQPTAGEEGSYSSAWKYDYLLDPDLSNVTITLTVTAPQFDLNGNQINAVSFGIQDINGNIMAWYWNVGVGQPIPHNVPTTLSINTALYGAGAATPVASGFMNNPVCNLATAQFLIVDENAAWVGGPMPAPPPGGTLPGLWNYWHNISVTPNPPPKWEDPVKWSQPPVEWMPGSQPPVYLGWDEYSMYHQGPPIVADDWQCVTEAPVTDIHWWGSFIGWDQPEPPQLPTAFHIAIWTDVPVGPDDDFSHPGVMVWENYCQTYEWNFAGYDHDPRIQDPEMFSEACFQFNQRLNPEEWFYQNPGPEGKNIYWLSIAAIYDNDPDYPWGWKTRPHFFNDDAVRIRQVSDPTGIIGWPPHEDWTWHSGEPIEYPEGESWDLAFELTSLAEKDLGDAPDSTNNSGASMTAYPGVQANFPTVYLTGSPPYGPIHMQPMADAYLGSAVTREEEADIGPDWDPTNNIIPPLDIPDMDMADDCINLPLYLPTCTPTAFNYTVTITNPLGSSVYVNAWFDWNRDGDWDDTMLCGTGAPAPEWAVQNQLVAFAAPGTYTVATPQFLPWHPTADPTPIWMRITLSEQPWQSSGIMYDGGSGPAGGYQYGETEDYYFTPGLTEEFDWGDAPDPNYPTLAASNGANHVIVPGIFMGAQIDGEPDGQPDPNALGDDNNGIDDEDGVVFTTPLVPGQPASLDITLSAQGYVNGWIDFGSDGSWAEAGDYIIPDALLGPGLTTFAFIVPNTAVAGQTFARFRFSTVAGLTYTGSAPDGEVEDYEVFITTGEELDWGDAPDPMYPTLSSSNGASHVIVPGMCMGTFIDAEPDGQPDPNALGDDNNGIDDEDGVTFVTPFIQWKYAIAKVNVTVDGFVDAWYDENADGDWNDPNEQLWNAAPVTAGVDKWMYIPVGGGVQPGGWSTFLRFRYSSVGGLPPTGPAPDGEVEDYEVRIEPEDSPKWAQPPDTSPMGMDVYAEQPRILADDFPCTKSGPITKIIVWYSNYQDMYPYPEPEFTLSIHKDIPARQSPTGYSMPGEVLWHCQFLPWPERPDPPYYTGYGGFYNLIEGWYDPMTGFYDPNGDTICRGYMFTIPYDQAFIQKGTENEPVIYWLDLQARDRTGNPITYQFGWKTSTTHWNDDAVWAEGTEPYVGTWHELRYPEGHQMYGESIDLAFEIFTEDIDCGDAPDPTYPTLLASNGASHDIVPGIFLGAGIDRDPDGQPHPNALGDDNDPDGDDEDGVTFLTPLVPGTPGSINVVAGVPGWLSGWIDFNGDGDWNDVDDYLLNWNINAGPNTIPIWTPAAASGGRNTFARFRFGVIQTGLETGRWPDGEVEDYQVYIYPNPIEVNKGVAKDLIFPIGTYLLIKDNVVTANFGANGWYFEEPDTPTAFGRYAGLGVMPSLGSIAPWQVNDLVTCYGTTAMYGNEFMLDEVYSYISGQPGSIKPVGQNNRSSGGGTFGRQPGYLNNQGTGELAYGLNTTALLVKLWGRCTYIETDPTSPGSQLNFWIDDGSALWDGTVDTVGNNVLGVKVKVPANLPTPIAQGSYYAVVGIMRTEGSPPNAATRWLWPRDANDVQSIP